MHLFYLKEFISTQHSKGPTENCFHLINSFFLIHRASDWKLDQPDWTGRLRIVTKSGNCSIKFEDKFSGKNSNDEFMHPLKSLTLKYSF